MSGIFETITEVEQELEKEKTATENVDNKSGETSEGNSQDIFKTIDEASKEESRTESIVSEIDKEGSKDK